VPLRNAAQILFAIECSGCHSGENAQVFNYVEDLDKLVAEGLVQTGDPEGSKIYTQIDSGAMPKNGNKLSLDEKNTVYEWIEECTGDDKPDPGDPPACPENEFISTQDMITTMLTEIGDPKQVDVEDQQFIRFLTLTHLHNAGYCHDQIDVYRHAMSKLLNSLSSKPKIHIPQAIDPDDTIYRIDLRDYGWNRDLWDVLVDRNPFAVEYVDAEAEQLKELTTAKVPFQMGDWLVTDASLAPFYDEILYVHVLKLKNAIDDENDPLNRADLEALLGISVETNIALETTEDGDEVERAGFQISGVSAQNRVIERHALPDSYTRSYWLSYDFLENVGTSNVFYHPLDFEAVGGEIIWSLPNGLQAYLLVNEAGDRIDEAPVSIVNNKEQGGAPIVNGMSCMGCHYQGMRAATDEVGPFVEMSIGVFTDEEKEEVANLYDDPKAFAESLQGDSDEFVQRVAETGAPLLIGGYEVATAVYLAFEEQFVDMRRAAAEFGLSVEQLKPVIGQLPDGLKMINGGMVTRSSMRAEYGLAICNLKLGITKACPQN